MQSEKQSAPISNSQCKAMSVLKLLPLKELPGFVISQFNNPAVRSMLGSLVESFKMLNQITRSSP